MNGAEGLLEAVRSVEACPEIRTDRTLLRGWRPGDRALFHALHSPPHAAPWDLPRTRAEADASIDGFNLHFAIAGFGVWALELPGTASFAGFVGLSLAYPSVHFAPAAEMSWRLDPKFRGRGYATEASLAVLQFGFEVVGLDEIVASAAKDNEPSRAVMQRIGMSSLPEDDFDHPLVPVDHVCGNHVLYRLSRKKWREETY